MNIFTPPTNFSKVSRIFLSLFTLLIFQTGFALAQDAPFITVWKTDIIYAGYSEENQIKIPGTGTDYLIEWEEVGNEANNNGSERGTDTHTITFPNAGTYRVKISGDFHRIDFNGVGDDESKLLEIEQWGDIAWSTFAGAFDGCSNLTSQAIDAPDLSNVTNLSGMFRLASNFNADINHWDVSNITNMYRMFLGAESFNQDLNSWDVSNVNIMSLMFGYAESFNGNISNWNVSQVTSFNVTFIGAYNFNQDIGGWDVSNASSFNGMFSEARSFNQNLGQWDISSATSSTSLGSMFNDTGLSSENYDNILLGWSQLTTLPTNITLGAQGQYYCNEAVRTDLITNFNWTFNGDELSCGRPFVSVWKTDNPGLSNNNQLLLPLEGNYMVVWQEVEDPTNKGVNYGSGLTTLNLPKAGTYRLKISSDLRNIRFVNNGDKDKILAIESWGNIAWDRFDGAFHGCSNLIYQANDNPDLSNVTTMSLMFAGALNFNANLESWNLSNVENMVGMLDNTSMSELNYQATLNGWLNNPETPSDISLGVIGLSYCKIPERESLINNKNWSFSGDIENCIDPFVTIWNTSNPGSSGDNEIIIPTKGTFNLEWEEVNNISNSGLARISGKAKIEFPSPGTYRVKIYEGLTQILFNQLGVDNNKIIDIENWGDIIWQNLNYAFYDCDNLECSATDIPDLSQLNSLNSTFRKANKFNGEIGNWDVSSINDFYSMFSYASNFNQDISSWNVSNATIFSFMFQNASNFNQDLSAWDVSKGENFARMFWNSAYNHSLANWSIESATTLNGIFPATYSRQNYQATLNGWAQQPNVPSNVEMRAYGMEYCIGSGRDFLVNNKNWTITDDQYFCGEPFTVVFNTENPGVSAANEVELPISGGPFYLEWEDVNDSSNTGSEITSGAKTLVFPHSGVFRVKISGDLEQIKFADKGDKLKLIALESWGDIYWQSLDSAFMGCANLLYEATDYPDLNSVKSLNYLFAGASKMDANIGSWDIRNIEDMKGMLDGTAMTEYNYEITLERWFDSYNCPTDITIGAERVKYCVSLGRDSLKQVKNWTFTGDQESCGESFITTWDTRNAIDGSTTTLFLPIRNNINEFFRVHWEEIDNNTNSGDTIFKYNEPILIFDSPGVYKVSIVGKTNRVRFTTEGNSEKNKLISIDQWGDTKWEALAFAFKDCDSLKYNATDAPDLNKVTTLESMFEDTQLFNGNINNWDVSSVTNMDHMFQNAKSFNQDLDTWDVSQVTSMVEIFSGAASFNGNISTWNVSNITSFEKLFFEATSFNQSLGNWDISNAIDMHGLFENTTLNQVNYESTLNGWAALTNVPDSIFLNSKGLIHCNSSARSFLIDQKGWNIIRDINICSDPFITVWKTDNQGSTEDNQIQFPGSGNYYSIEWEELNNPSNHGIISTIGNPVITLPNPGKYILSVRGDLKSINFQSYNYDQTKLVEIKQWGEIAWNSFENAFYQCDSLTYSAIDTPDLSNVTNLSSMFSNAYSFNGEIDNWDISNVTDMSNMFRNARSFNQNLDNWDVSGVSDMTGMFNYSGLDSYNYDQTLIGWAGLENISSGVSLGAINMKYCLSEAARDKLINEKGWTISGDTKDCQATFISTWKTDNDGSSENNQISIPGIGAEYIVHWEEVENIENSGQERANNTHTLTFPQAGTYRIKINGDFYKINFSDLGDKSKILDIENWGDIQWTSMNTAFAGAENLTISANDVPNLSQVTDMSRMFYNAKSLNQDISHWDMSTVTNMSDLFHGASSFNQDLSNWDVSNVTKMTRMFASATSFNQDLNSWNTENVVEMDFMFWEADAFQGNISDWNTSEVNNMWGMFYGADSMNTDISNWDVSSVTNMTEMFREAVTFNQNLSNWNVSNVTEMSGMFYEATTFDQNLGSWNLTNAGSLFEFLTNSGLSVQNYDSSLEGWATNANIPSDIALSAEGLFYCASAEYRQQLIDDFGWNIMGDETCSLIMEETMPAAEATSVEKDTEIHLTFDQEIQEIDLSGITLKDVSGNAISLTDIYIDSLTLHLVHSGLGSNTYQVDIPENSIVSITGKENDAISWSFATQRILSSKDEQKLIEHSAYPNPFSDFTTIQFNLPQTQSVKLLVFDLKGQLVRQDKYENLGSEKQSIKFERRGLRAGLYRYQLQSAGGSVGGKMLIE